MNRYFSLMKNYTELENDMSTRRIKFHLAKRIVSENILNTVILVSSANLWVIYCWKHTYLHDCKRPLLRLIAQTVFMAYFNYFPRHKLVLPPNYCVYIPFKSSLSLEVQVNLSNFFKYTYAHNAYLFNPCPKNKLQEIVYGGWLFSCTLHLVNQV